jgi:hypothetical protein
MAMRPPEIDDCVRLMADLPELDLHQGELGVVRSTWFAPTTAYEVEFHPNGLNCPPRVLLLSAQIQVVREPTRTHSSFVKGYESLPVIIPKRN